MALLKWIVGTREKYDALATKDQNGVYFLTDTHEVYYQGIAYEQAAIFYTGDLPATGVEGKLYVSGTDNTVKYYKNAGWTTLVDGVSATVTNDAGEAFSTWVSGVAAKAYADDKLATQTKEAIMDIVYDPDAKKLTMKNAAGTDKEAILTKFASDLKYDPATGNVTIEDVAGTELGKINIPLDRYVTAGKYDKDTKAVVLTMSKGDSVSIAATDIVKLYNESDSKSVNVTVLTQDGVNFLQFDVSLSATEGNELSLKDDGLYTTVASLVEKLTAAEANQILAADAEGAVKSTGHTIGAATLADTPNDTTNATEAAAKAGLDATAATLDATYVKQEVTRSSYAEFCDAWSISAQ